MQDSFQKVFFKACEEIGIKKVPDVQDFKTANAVGVSHKIPNPAISICLSL